MQYTISFLVLFFIVTLQLNAAQAENNKRILRTSFNTEILTLDPAIGYDWANYHTIIALGCRLLNIGNDSTDPEMMLTPELATSYTISGDNKSYTFNLNGSWRFNNGRLIEAQDVKYSIERILAKNTNSPGAAFFEGILGYEDFYAGKTSHVLGIEVLSPHKIKFTLKRPQVSFLFGLTTNFGIVVPQEEVTKGNFDRYPVSCGPFMVDSFENNKLVLKASPYHPKATEQSWDKIIFFLKENHNRAIIKLLKGDLDIILSYFTTSRAVNPYNDEELAKRLIQSDGLMLNTIFIAINRNIKPFDNLKVRQALNMAVNKKAIQNIFVGNAVVATQVLPPNMLGHNPQQNGYPYDIEKARTLLREAGYPNGFSTELLVLDEAWIIAVARTIQASLAELGVQLTLRPINLENFLKLAANPNQAPLVFSEGVAWIADYPDPSNFYLPLFSVNSAKGGWNWSFYTNPNTDFLAYEADSIVDPKLQTLRAKKWQTVFEQIHTDAAWIPLYHNQVYILKAPDIKIKKGASPYLNFSAFFSNYYETLYRE